ncbi:MAG: CDP-diacylglycerol--serine O-phosphatidyltransferase [Rhizobiales bacterium]|jgi:CDP-diacylglycerol--serine O-phosphatidyltransferase|nr:CDP-diacylglycerol--serine O-phosphatidyltransferase [Hyphomicrobiales bacterium]
MAAENEPRPAARPSASGPRIREIPVRVVVPNLITVLAVCAGLTGVRFAFEGRFELAVALLLLAALLDFVDGRAARLLKASTKFGAQMDSLADVVNFGVAPALVLYAYLLERAGSIGWIAALLFAIACALRLARFNVMLEDPDQPAWEADYFVGVPAPAGAVLLLLPVYLGFIGVPLGLPAAYAATAYTVAVALLLISRIRVYSGKGPRKNIRRDVVPPAILLVVLYVLLFFNYTWYTLAISSVLYLLLLPVSMRAYAARHRREMQEKAG